MKSVQNDFRSERSAILRRLAALNTFNLLVVCLIALLGLVAVWLAYRARQDAESLWRAAPLQARASRLGGENGWRSETLKTIAAASAVRPSIALRNEAIAALAAADIEPTGIWIQATNTHTRFSYTSDLGHCALGLPDGTIRIFDFKKGRELGQVKGPEAPVMLAFSPDNRFLAARFWRGEIRVWRFPGFEQVLAVDLTKLQGNGLVHFSKSALFANISPREIATYDAETFQPLKTVETPSNVEKFAVSTGGGALVYSEPGNIRLIDLSGTNAVKTLPIEDPVFHVTISPDGTYVAAGGIAQRIFLWNLRRGDRKILTGHGGTIFHLLFSNDSALLASCAYGGTSRIWNSSTGEPIIRSETVFATTFAADRQTVACYSVGRGTGIWRLKESDVCKTFAAPLDEERTIASIEFSANTNVLLLCRGSGAELIDVRNSALLAKAPLRRGRAATFGADERVVYTTSLEGMQAWPIEGDKDSPRFGKPEKIPTGKKVAYEGLVLSPNKENCVVWLDQGRASLINLATRQAKFPLAHGYATKFEFSPNGQWLATGTFHGDDTRIWDAATGKLMQVIGEGDATPVFSADSRWFANSQSTGCSLYDTATWTRKHLIQAAAATGLSPGAVFSPDGEFLVYAARRRLLQLIRPETGTELASIIPSEHHQIEKLAFSRDGNLLAVAMNDETIQTWNIKALEQELAPLGLNWNQPIPQSLDLGPVRWVTATAVASLLLVIALSSIGWIRHRQFLKAYLGIEALTEEQHKALRNAEAELYQSQKLKALGTLAAGIAHDFNNLLSVIRMSNQLTREETAGNPDVQENIKIIERSVMQGKNVVCSMLGYSRAAGEARSYSVAEIVKETTQLLHQEFLQRVQLSLVADDGLPPASGIPNRLEQILLNIIINAAEAMKGGGALTITTKRRQPFESGLVLRPARPGELIELSITDAGPGMPREVLERIFEPFFTTKNVGNERGTGLGLSLVFTLAQAEGMGLAVESQLGSGTTFRIYVPVTNSEKSELPNPAVSAKIGL